MPTKDEAIDALSTAIGIALLTSQHTPVSIPIDVARIALLHLRGAATQPVAEERLTLPVIRAANGVQPVAEERRAGEGGMNDWNRAEERT